MTGAAASDVVAVRVTQNNVALHGVVERDRGPPILRDVSPADFARAHALGIEIGDRLTALQTIEFRRFGRSEAVADECVQPILRREAKARLESRRERVETIGAIGRSAVEAAARAAGAAVFGHVAVAHPVVVPIARTIGAHGQPPIEALRSRVVARQCGGHADDVRPDGVIVMSSGRTNRARRGAALERRSVLHFEQTSLRRFGIDAQSISQRCKR